MNIDEVKRILRSLGVKPQKNRGQNFLLSDHLAEEIISFACLDFSKPILEIGPGLGILTKYLSKKQDNLSVVELEDSFSTHLRSKYPKVKIIQSDIRKIDLKNHFEKPVQIISNLPYSISSEVLFWLIEQRKMISQASLLLQEEFAQRIASGPNNKSYGILSVQAQVFFEPELGLSISGDSFYPPAGVESQLLKLKTPEKERYQIDDYKFFASIVRAAFATRRKTLYNNLKKLGFSNLDMVLSDLKIDPSRRAETLSVQEFVDLARCL